MPVEPMWVFGESQTVCPVYGCGETYEAFKTSIACPKCGFSEKDVELAETNVPELILEHFRRSRK